MSVRTIVIALVFLAGCQVSVPPGTPPAQPPAAAFDPDGSPAARFRSVVVRVAPVIVNTCRSRTPRINCNFLIGVDTRPGLPPNAFQTIDRTGRPVIGFTAALLSEARNADELAFILGHEAAHHIAGHIPQSQQRAAEGAVLGAVLAGALGLDAAGARQAQQLGGALGARRYAKEFELEADAIGARIAVRSGFNPVRGAAFFTRIPDPGNRFLGTHPPNAERIAVVRRAARSAR